MCFVLDHVSLKLIRRREAASNAHRELHSLTDATSGKQMFPGLSSVFVL